MVFIQVHCQQRKNRMFVFYDTETTGLDTDFSQILQIALVFTDDDLNILSSKKLECRRSPWVVPSPGALLTTGFTPDDLKNSKYSHYEMMQEVNKWVGSQHWPLTFIGYNSIGFDEPVLAQNFYQNLLDPRLTSSANDANDQSSGCADVMILAKAVALYMPGVLKLDILTAKGNPSMTLQNVAMQNGVPLSDDDAHDAMNDIKATVGVAKLIRKAAPQVWDHLMTLSTAEGVNEFLGNHEVFTYAVQSYGLSKAFVVTSLAEREGAAVQSLYDLSVDPAPYLNMTVDQLKHVFLAKAQSNPFMPVEKAKQPILMPMDLSEAVIPEAYDEKLYAARARAMQSNKVFLENVAKASLLAAEIPVQKLLPEMMIDKKIDAPVRHRLELWMEEFHDAQNWHDAAQLLENFCTRFEEDLAADPSLSRFARFAARIVYEHAPGELGAEKQEMMKKRIAARVLNHDLKAPYMTVAKARQELAQIELERAKGKNKKWAEVTDGQIRSLKLYYTSIEKECAAYAPPVNDNASTPPEAKKIFNRNDGPK